jgi:endoglucanase
LILIDKAVKWSKKYGMYLLIDWHSIGNLVQKIYLDPVSAYYTTKKETKGFWKAVAERYKDEPPFL